MLLTCPNCNSQFKAPDSLLGPSGRKVKCSACKEIWFQRPFDSDEEALVDDNIEDQSFSEMLEALVEGPDDVVPIPQSVKPPEQDIIRKTPPLKYKTPVLREGQKSAYALSAFVFIILLSFLLAFNDSIMQSYPAARGFFGLFGISKSIAGEGLVFDKMKAEATSDCLKISGAIINLGKKPQEVPMIEAVLLGPQGPLEGAWYIEPPKKIIGPEESISLTALHVKTHNIADNVREMSVRFVLYPKIGAEGGDNTPVPPAGAETHLSDHGEGEESPPHASFAPHQESSHHLPPSDHPAPHDPHTGAPEDQSASHH